MRRWRVVLAVAGVLVLGYGAARLLTGNSVAACSARALAGRRGGHPRRLVSPAVLGAGGRSGRVPPRARRFLQAGLVVGRPARRGRGCR